MPSNSPLAPLGLLLGATSQLQDWCETKGLSDWSAFLQYDLSVDCPSADLNWPALQDVLNQALKDVDNGQPERANSSLARHLADLFLYHHQHPQEISASKIDALVCSLSTSSLRKRLGLLGGVAGARALGEPFGITPRQVRDRLRHSAHTDYLGAGYYALSDLQHPSVLQWIINWLRPRAHSSVKTATQAILNAFPHGDPNAIRSWMRQDPSPIEVRTDTVHLLTHRTPC